MKMKGEIFSVHSNGENLEITVGNVRGVNDAEWKPCREQLKFSTPLSSVKSYLVGRIVKIEIKPQK